MVMAGKQLINIIDISQIFNRQVLVILTRGYGKQQLLPSLPYPHYLGNSSCIVSGSGVSFTNAPWMGWVSKLQ
jgi:hypothetical protein